MIATVAYEEFRNASLFHDLPDEVLNELAQHSRMIELHAGEKLFLQDDPSDAMYILTEGQIHVVRTHQSGDEVVLATEGPYYVIGELSMLARQPRSGAVEAVSDCALIALEREDFFNACERVPGVAIQVMRYLSRRLYRMNLLVREQALGNIAARIASVLLLLSCGEAGEISGAIRVSRLARAVAIDADAVERMLKEWAALGYVEFDGRNLNVLNVEAIQNIAG